MTIADEPADNDTVSSGITEAVAESAISADPASSADDSLDTPPEHSKLIEEAVPGAGVAERVRMIDAPEPPPAATPAGPASTSSVNAELAPDADPREASAAAPRPVFDLTRFDPLDVADDDSVGFGFNLAKVSGRGEDADPLQFSDTDLVVAGVFDGMGGAGGTTYETPDGAHTGAYLASRTARAAVANCLADVVEHPWPIDAPRLADKLALAIGTALSAQLAGLNAPRSGLRSRMIRALPTTMALAVAQRETHDGSTWTCHLFWAGDSRVYVLQPEAGAAQLTVDDIRDRGDAMANLREDSVLSNAISADTPFVINTATVELTQPFLLVGATDGCFGYLASPMHFERLLLGALRDAGSVQEWSRRVQEAVSAVTGDDAATTVVGRGLSYEGVQQAFAERTNTLDNTWVRPLDGLAADQARLTLELELQTRTHRDAAAELWADYKTDYERFLTGPTTVEDAS